MTALEPGAAGAFWQALARRIDAACGGRPPRAIVVASAHTLTREPVLLAAARHHTVHDFYGFPEALYQLRWDAPGAPALAPRVAQLLQAAGLPAHRVDEGGLDHGIWAPLRFMWPAAEVPVLPLGFSPSATPRQLLALGRALAPLAAEGVLVLGTGGITHNLRLLQRGASDAPDAPEVPERPESADFRRWFAEHGAAADWDALCDYRTQAPHAALMHPSDEHLLPFYVAAGAGWAADAAAPAALRLHDSVRYGCLGMDGYAFGPAAAALQQSLHTPQAA